ncbi:MAG: hypothetical protein DWQ01_12545 [Planctomycetota bacterium]|nr:MAG: hypothetical protein DWQ01_12545 [Planctomycetota bacterium]
MIALTCLSLLFFPQAPEKAQGQQPLAEAREPGLPQGEALRFPGERHFGKIRRLTRGGENAEGYFNWQGDQISYQASFGPYACDQIFTMDLLTGARRLVSTGKGRTTCAYFMPDDRSVIFASTHGADPGCLEPPDYSQGYVWKIYPEFDLYVRHLDSGNLKVLAPSPGYDAEAVVSPTGDKIVFTSTRNGDLDIYLMNVDGTGLRQLTDAIGYDGGPFFSPDGKRIVYRAFHPKTEKEKARYLELLGKDLIEPMALQIMVMDLASGEVVQVTHNEAANFAPYFHPDNERIIYCSNQDSPSGRDFDLYLIGDDGSNNQRITFNPSFDGFPMFSHDGKRLIFASNRANDQPRETNLFLAEWVEPAEAKPASHSR